MSWIARTFLLAAPLAVSISVAAGGCHSDSGVTAAAGADTALDSGADSRRPDLADALPSDTGLADMPPGDAPTGADSADARQDTTASDGVSDATESDPREDSEPSDAVIEDLPEDAFPDLGPLDDGDADDPVADMAADSTPSTSVTEVELKLETDGGFTGLGATDYDLVDGNLAVHSPFHSPTDCNADLTEGQMSRLNGSASLVDWPAIEPSYINPENPLCCCDQIVSGLTASLTFANADPLTVVTEWCDESLTDERMPIKFLNFLSELSDIGQEVLDTCSAE